MERLNNYYLDLIKLLVNSTDPTHMYHPTEIEKHADELVGYSSVDAFGMGVAQGKNLLAQKALILLEQINKESINE